MSTSLTPQPRLVRSRWRMVGRALLIFAAVLAVVVGLTLWYASTSQFSNRVRYEVIDVLERSTGGKVDLASFSWHLSKLEVEVDGLTIHGLEGPREVPYAHLDKLLIRAKIISIFRAEIGLRLLQAEHPVFHLIVYPDGTTNQPTPKTEAKSDGKNVVDEVFDLAVDHTQIDNGLLILNERQIPFSVSAEDLSAIVDYASTNGHYSGSLSVADLNGQSGKSPMVHSKLNLSVDLGRNEAKLTGLHFSSGDSTLEASANIKDFNNPHWQMAAKGAVDLREVASIAGVAGLQSGSVDLNVSGQGIAATQFDVNGNAALHNAAFKNASVMVAGLNASTNLRVTQDEIVVPNFQAKLKQGGVIEATVELLHWMAPTPPTTVTAAQKTARPIATKGPAPDQQQAKIALKLRGIRMQTLLEMAAARKYQDLGFDTALSGTTNIAWKGTIAAMTAETKLVLAPPAPPAPGQIPVRGLLDATYINHGGRVVVRNLEAHTPGSSVHVSGEAGLYPATGPATLQLDLSLTNLAEFNRALIAAGVSANGKRGVAALPVSLQGQAGFHGALTGSLLAPDVKGHVSAKQFSTEIPVSAPAPAKHGKEKKQITRTMRDGKAVLVVKMVPAAPEPVVSVAPAKTQSIQWDDLEADVEYSEKLISVQQATLSRGKTMIHASGQLHAHQLTRGRFAFDDDASISATAQIANASIPDLLSIAGQNLPITGTLNLQVTANGELGKLSGGGLLNVTGGSMYGQPYKNLKANLQLSGKQVQVPQFTFELAGGKIAGDASYDTAASTFKADATGTGFQIQNLQQVQAIKFRPQGALTFDLHASGTAQNPVVSGNVALDNMIAGGQKIGALQIKAHTTDGIIYFDAHSNIVNAQLVLAGQVTPRDDFNAKAQLSLSHLDINPIMEMMNVQGVTGHSIIDGTVNVAGPLKTPRLLEGDARISQFSVGVQKLTLASQAPLHASLRAGIVTLDPLHISGQDTDFTAQGTADILGEGDLDVQAAGSVDVKLAQVLDSEILSSGKINFNVNAGGSIKDPDLTGQVKLTDVGISYQEFPSGISQLNGTLLFNQNRLDFKDVTGVSGGGQVKVTGYISAQQGIYGDVKLSATNVRFRYLGISTTADAAIRLQGSQDSLQIGGSVLITRFVVSPNVDFAALAGSGAVSPPPDPSAFGNKIKLDVHVASSPQLDFQNSYAQLAGAVDLRIRGTVEQPSVLGNITITEGTATFAGTTYQLEHGDIYFTNPVRIEPTIDIDAVTRVEQYDVTIGLHGTMANLQPNFRSEPPLPEADVVSLLALGRTQDEQSIYSQEQTAAGVNGTTDALLGGALNATVSSRIQKLFGVGSVKIDPTYQSALGDTSARITVSQNIGKSVTAMFATNVNTSAQQLIQAQWNLTDNLSLTAVRDEANVFSLTFKIHHRYR